MLRHSFFSGSPRESGGLSDAIFSTTFSQSGSAAAAAGAAAPEAAAEEAVVVPVAPLDDPLSQAKANIDSTMAKASVVFMVNADTAELCSLFRASPVVLA